jgi:hypothetical protein
MKCALLDRDRFAAGLLIATLALAVLLLSNATAHAQEPAAENFVISDQQCTADGVKVSFRWNSASQGEQWLEYSRIPNNFTSDALGVGPLTPQTTTGDIGGLTPRTAYYTRVNTLVGETWSSGSTLSFSTRSCEGASSSASTSSQSSTSSSDDGGASYGDGGDAGGGAGGYY